MPSYCIRHAIVGGQMGDKNDQSTFRYQVLSFGGGLGNLFHPRNYLEPPPQPTYIHTSRIWAIVSYKDVYLCLFIAMFTMTTKNETIIIILFSLYKYC